MAAVIFKKNNERVYVSGTGVITSVEKKKAEKLDERLRIDIKNLENKLQKESLITQDGIKKNALKIWYEFGLTIRKITHEFKVIGTNDEPFFWRAIYDHVGIKIQRKPMPKKSMNWKQNHFRLCYIIAQHPWNEIQEIGNWSIWKDILDNKTILEEDRLLNWTTKKIIFLRRKGFDHKKIRKFFYSISNKLKKIDISVLTNLELEKKLASIKLPKL